MSFPRRTQVLTPHLIALACATWCTTLALPAQAQNAALERVEITGSSAPADNAGVAASALRTPIAVERTPQSVVVISRQTLDEQGITTLAQAIGNVSNVRGVDERDLNNGQALIRGFGAGVLLDGLALPGLFSTPTVIDSARRIEVLKGPGSALYGGAQAAGGSGFVGGLIAITSAAPEPVAAYSVAARLGSYSERAAAVDLNRPMSASSGVRLVASASSQGSEVDRITTRRRHLEPSFAWRPTADSELLLRLRSTRSEAVDYAGLPVNGTLVDAGYTLPRNRILNAEGQPDTTNTLDSLNLQWRMKLGELWKLQLTLGRVNSEVDQRGAFAFPFAYDPATPASPFILLAGARLWEKFESTSFAPSLTGVFAGGGTRHTVVAGADIDYTRDNAFLRFSPNFGALGLADVTHYVAPAWAEPDGTTPPSQRNQYRSKAFYLQDQVDIGALGLLAGVRHTRIDIVDVNPEGFVANTSSNSATTARAGVTYAFTSQLSAFTGWAQGMKVPTYAILLEPPKPEKSAQKEVGLRLTRLDGVSASLAWYELTVDNALVANPDPLAVGTSVQAGRKQSRGVDLDLTWQASPQWHGLLALSRASATISEDSRAALVGKQLFSVPRTTARVATRYSLGAGSAMPGLSLGLGLTHHSALPGDNSNSFFTPSATVFDTQAAYRIGDLQLSLNVRNLTDKKYWEPSRYFGGGQVTPAPRRTLALQGQLAF